MIKYIPEDTDVVFEEIPDEVTLAINISNCIHHCEGCHSPYLQTDVGKELTEKKLQRLIVENDGITCVCFMGEGNDEAALKKLINYVRANYPDLKIGLYSGRKEIKDEFYWDFLDYIKLGPYIPSLGPLNVETTNQRLHKKVPECAQIFWEDITEKFWKEKV